MLHSLAVLKLSIITHCDSGALSLGRPPCIGGNMRYQPTNASTAAWCKFTNNLYCDPAVRSASPRIIAHLGAMAMICLKHAMETTILKVLDVLHGSNPKPNKLGLS